jgi:hypothetical protein
MKMIGNRQKKVSQQVLFGAVQIGLLHTNFRDAVVNMSFDFNMGGLKKVASLTVDETARREKTKRGKIRCECRQVTTIDALVVT